MKMQLLPIAMMVVLASCGVTTNMKARSDLEHSKTAYDQCLFQHADHVNECASLADAYARDLTIYKASSHASGQATLPPTDQAEQLATFSPLAPLLTMFPLVPW